MNPTSRSHLLSLFSTLKSFDRREFTFGELKTSYQPSTINKYLTTYLEGYCKRISSNRWICEGINDLTNEQFLILMSQKNINHLTYDVSSRLIFRSKEAFLSSLIIYNNPLQPYRLESFLILLLNAWELLLKYEIVQIEGEELIYSNKDEKKTITITKCINKRLKENDPIRDNLEFAVSIRNEASHFVIPETLPVLSRLLYSTVHNYMERYRSLINELPLAPSTSMINMIIDENPLDQQMIIKNYGKKTATQIFSMIDRIDNKAKEVNSEKFFISFDYKIALIKKEKKADINLTIGIDGKNVGAIETTVSIDKKYPYKSKGLIDYLNSNITPNIVNQYHLNAVNHVYDIKQDDTYYYLNENVSRYSQKFADWFIQEYLKEKDWISGVLEEYKKTRNKKSKLSKKMHGHKFSQASKKLPPN
ncbi:DUF3644 domain-containing protein [Legionella resiliens]|uniref:DUF3644 domain-containing protein n=1 Tax=Legionella resiliens TaxID=2905958 RepID=A0ABS8WZM8_9GAMM|nr:MULTISPECIES: DUF3644 domain-containing protein [unclassified Legionella]MCE0721837.1 DUF3644 domain-containing protein [Legionella sp. 9fVS26]MCE3530991.1 DUF3644 domain-containing protein [Legionella sp. 8cVS16]